MHSVNRNNVIMQKAFVEEVPCNNGLQSFIIVGKLFSVLDARVLKRVLHSWHVSTGDSVTVDVLNLSKAMLALAKLTNLR